MSKEPTQPPGNVLGVVAEAEAASGGDSTAPPTAATLDADAPPVPYWRLYSTADPLDMLLVFLGAIGAIGNGAMLPLFSLFLGAFTQAFGTYIPFCGGVAPPPGFMSDGEFRASISGVALNFLYVAIGAAVAGTLQQACWMLSGNRQANRIRRKYLAAVLRQDVGFFDTQATTGGLLQGLNEDSLAIQAALSEKVGLCLQHMTTFIAGFVLSFIKGWDVTLVLCACLPFLAATGGLLAKASTGANTRSQKAYTEAGAVVQQGVSQIRTVAAYNGEARAVEQYNELLTEPQQARGGAAWRGALFSGLGRIDPSSTACWARQAKIPPRDTFDCHQHAL
ncbi:ATP-binding cassette, subfamily B(MDR/TAP), member 1 [Monoraphidium neglectum]|uniref:ATP-binding cassette, subfamily B(MDR/TAP), member 1 n=1 Tax=Monoraphidium neglectum TaxID=145388 RepID=A0A0D2LW73_9CHLO|nr:ATP-binding cassette, subfamily B(MDR/TAP), member 1 [Monoraphidium neglectum]KIY93806.1 ATP-binding cassette, subfamily B(MDR/TAP), member 1 [Monoraphidium neglectum]|eukprot:XP_013892826.1 ATP-binding cassette, subfamily B(MDR/TAP), member 1 [Monoraphidium neglectum]